MLLLASGSKKAINYNKNYVNVVKQSVLLLW